MLLYTFLGAQSPLRSHSNPTKQTVIPCLEERTYKVGDAGYAGSWFDPCSLSLAVTPKPTLPMPKRNLQEQTSRAYLKSYHNIKKRSRKAAFST